MATARSYPAQDAGRQSDSADLSQAKHPAVPARHAWRILAQLPDVPLPEPERASAPASTATSDPVYRFDPPETPQPHEPAEIAASRRVAAQPSGKKQGGTSHGLPDATGLPLWARTLDAAAGVRASATAIDASRKASLATAVTRFLLLVILFAAASLSIRMMSAARNQPTPAPIRPPSPASESAAHANPDASPTPAVPHSEASPNPAASASTATEGLLPGAITPATVAVDQLPTERDDEHSVTVTYPRILRLSPRSAESLEPDGAAAPSRVAPAVARLPGTIEEIPPHQAQHDQNEPHVH